MPSNGGQFVIFVTPNNLQQIQCSKWSDQERRICSNLNAWNACYVRHENRYPISNLFSRHQKESQSAQVVPILNNDRITEEDEDGMDVGHGSQELQPSLESQTNYVWRTNLFQSEVYWRGWFEGLSDLFLAAPCSAKLLLLAGIDRLDRTLTVGQMQG